MRWSGLRFGLLTFLVRGFGGISKRLSIENNLIFGFGFQFKLGAFIAIV